MHPFPTVHPQDGVRSGVGWVIGAVGEVGLGCGWVGREGIIDLRKSCLAIYIFQIGTKVFTQKLGWLFYNRYLRILVFNSLAGEWRYDGSR
jgi:hypothetical protein